MKLEQSTMKPTITARYGPIAIVPRRLRLILSYPRVGMNVVPSHARPSLFGCD